ncbi:MAG: T9SS type A sorting domain-containing protein [Taibaiella sp.]
MTRKIYLLLSLVLCMLYAGTARAQTTTTFTLTQAPCNANGILTANFTGLVLPLTVTWYLGGSPVTHTNVTTLSDALTGYAGQHVSVVAVGANNVAADGYYQGAPPFTYQVSITPATCPAVSTATATVFGGTAPYSYQWIDPVTSTIVSTANPAPLPNGSYDILITDANGCTFGSQYQPDSIYVFSTAPFNFGLSAAAANCTNGSVTITGLSGGVLPYTYLWSNGATTSSINNLTAGSYNVTVTDGQGCQRMHSEHVNQAITIGANATVTPTTCTQNDGSIITFGSGGMPPYTYLYSNGGTTQTQSGLAAGIYNVTVTDANGCTGASSVYLNSSTPVSATYTATPSSCTSPTGSATLTINGGVAPYTVSWATYPAQSGTTATNLAPGNYPFHITDANGCVQNGSAVVPPVNVVTATVTGTSATCLLANGSINVVPSGGTAPYSYLWSNSATTANITGLAAGSYSVQITDASGCAITRFRNVNASSPVNIGLVTTPATCIYSSNGSIAANALGGTAPYTYNWSNGQTTSTITGLATGSYYVNVTDANGCTAHDFAQVTSNNSSNSCYCTITGTVYNDANGNCVMDAGENGIPNIQIHCVGFGYAYTNASGVYSFQVPTGTYTLTQAVLATYPLAGCQNNAIPVTATAAAGCTQTVNFANVINPLHDIHISLWDNVMAVPGNVYGQNFIITNQGTITENSILAGYHSDGQINTASISPSGIFASPSANYYTTSGSTFPSLIPGTSQLFSMTYNVPTNIPMGTNLVFRDSAVHISPMSGWINDYSPWNNVNLHNATVVSSYDPNFLQVNPKGDGPMGYITRADSTLEYMVHFQNLGTYKAQNVVVIDTLDPNLDWSSLRPVYSSHKARVSIDEHGVLKYTFKDIQLPAKMYDDAGSNGMFTFTIKLKPNLAYGTQIWNQAGIYFDYNEPVITNTVVNTLKEPTDIDNRKNKEQFAFAIYPNPARTGFTAVVDNKIANAATSITITDISGRTIAIKEMHLQSGKQLIPMNTEALTDGVYFVNLNIEGNKSTQKLVIVK